MSEPEPWSERIIRVLDYIHDHLDEETLSPEVLAQVAGFSLHHFHRVFRGMVGESVMGCIRRLRLEKGAQRLRFTQQPVTDVALSSGYQSHEAFTRAFRARFGLAPSMYRSEYMSADEAAVRGRMITLAGYDLVALRHVGAYETCSHAWDRLVDDLGRQGALPHRQASFGLVYDDPEVTAAERLRYDACVALPLPVLEQLKLPPGSVRRKLPGGRYAAALYVGPYESMTETYVRFLGGWLPHRGVELVNEPVVEMYLNQPGETPAAELRTEICVRLNERPESAAHEPLSTSSVYGE